MAPPSSIVSRSEAQAESFWKVHAVLVLVQCGIAGGNVISKVALTAGVNPIVYAVYRDVIAFLALAPWAYFAERGKRVYFDRTAITLVLLLGLGVVSDTRLLLVAVPGVFVLRRSLEFVSYFCGRSREGDLQVYCAIIFSVLSRVFAHQLLMLFGLELATPSLASAISMTVPVLVFFISAVFGLEHINWRRFDGQAKVVGCICAVGGGAIVAVYKGPAILGALSPGLHNSPGSELQVDGKGTSLVTMVDLGIESWQIGVILCCLGAICFATTITLQVPLLKRCPAPVSIAAISYFGGALALAILGLLTVQDSSEWVLYRQPSTIIAVLYMGLIASGANWTLLLWAVQKAGPVFVASYHPLQPFVTSTLSLIFLGESIQLGCVLGTLVIISGLYSITWGKMKDQQLRSLLEEAVPTPDVLSTIKVTSSLQEPLLK